jgi:hypothetical protein
MELFPIEVQKPADTCTERVTGMIFVWVPDGTRFYLANPAFQFELKRTGKGD